MRERGGREEGERRERKEKRERKERRRGGEEERRREETKTKTTRDVEGERNEMFYRSEETNESMSEEKKSWKRNRKRQQHGAAGEPFSTSTSTPHALIGLPARPKPQADRHWNRHEPEHERIFLPRSEPHVRANQGPGGCTPSTGLRLHRTMYVNKHMRDSYGGNGFLNWGPLFGIRISIPYFEIPLVQTVGNCGRRDFVQRASCF
ncbi:hypothetical protein ACO22_07579 [Paracoccidioides brasiliensis]|uniref:Uncharacterized protein n=1 Tax=Paracoccidioides brasiliensis TaxID=121759 RepID=A0A1D2J486_PARBR|nr:hypothetical protein ACO22_07579 [Paracoccidioides brasiliensis]